MSDNKFIERLKGKETAKSVLEVKNQATKLSFANMPQGTSNAIDVFSDHRGNATAVLNGTTNWKVSNSNLLLASTVSGDGQDFTSTYSVAGTGLWVNASYTFPSTGDPRHPVAMVFNPSTKWVLKLCGDSLIVDGGSVVDFTLLVKIGTANVYSKNFTIAENAGQFSKEFILDFGEANSDVVKAGGLSTLTVQLLCGTANASARIYNGMTVLTCLQRKVDASAVSNSSSNVEDVLDGNIIPSDYFSNPEFIDYVEDGKDAYAVFTRDGDDINLSGWTPKDEIARKEEIIVKSDTIPTATADLVGSVYQYIGITSQTYTHGYIYECVSDGQEPATYSWERIDVQPVTEVIDNLTSTSATSALSANQGRILNDRIDDVSGRGRFLALWNCATGLAESNPPTSPYQYKAGDYFIVGTISSATPAVNYKPDGSSYTTGVASTTIETAEVKVDDVYLYDGTNWKLLASSQRTYTFAGIAGSPYDNTNLSNALNAKQNTLTAGVNISIVNDVISSTAQESFFRGNFNEWSDVPTDTSLYQEDIHGNRVPKDTDFIIVEDASQFVPSGSLMHKLVVENLHTAGEGFTIRITDENGVSQKYYYASYLRQFVAIDDYYSLKYIGGAPGLWYIKTNDGSPIIIKGTTYQSGEALLCLTDDPATPFDVGMPPSAGEYTGAWRFAYYGVWSTDGITGWTPQYKIENTLPIADAITLGIAKLYTTTGNNTDGSMTQKSITDALSAKQDNISDLATIRSGAALGATAVQPGDLATVATTGDYDDLLNKPTIPAAQVNSDWDSVSGVAQILNKPNLATVATSGNYNDLSNKPTIPTVNDATLTIQKNGTTVNTFTANASSNVTANITVPTDTNDLTNGAGYITGINSTDVTNALGYTPVDPSSLATVATTGDYDDLLNKPTIPTVNDATITITQGGVTKGSFTLNQASGDTIALTDTTYSVMTGASAGDAGTSGLVPAPAAGDQGKFLQGDGTWANPTAATAWGNITGTLSNQTDLATALSGKADTDLSNLTATGKGKLGPDVYHVNGIILNSGSDPIIGVGSADVYLYKNGIARIDFVIRINTAGSSSSNFAYGINRDAIANLNSNIPTITPVSGGCYSAYNGSGAWSRTTTEYGGAFEPSNQFWLPGRVYTTDGAYGSWPANKWAVNEVLVGTVFGTYTV